MNLVCFVTQAILYTPAVHSSPRPGDDQFVDKDSLPLEVAHVVCLGGGDGRRRLFQLGIALQLQKLALVGHERGHVGRCGRHCRSKVSFTTCSYYLQLLQGIEILFTDM